MYENKLKSLSVGDLIANLSSKDAPIKYESSKLLIEISEENPKITYPYFDDFVLLLDNDNNILKWTGIIIIGNLSNVAPTDKIKKNLPKLYSLLNTGKMITAGNASLSLAKIAKNKSKFAQDITRELLKVEKYKYDTLECSNIAIGHVVNAFQYYLDNPNKDVIDFIKRAKNNPRHATQVKAEKYLKSLSK